MKRFLPIALAAVLPLPAQTIKQDVLKRIDETKSAYEEIAQKIWSFAEVGYQETKSSALLQAQLKQEGFTVQAGVAGIPTAFVASYGSGHPVFGILGEFDALPGVSQDAVPEKKERPGVKAGHACGHNLFGAASAEAAVAVKDWMKATGQTGTIRMYGTPAEEGGSGKVYLVRAGLFNDVDVVLHWHPGDRNGVMMESSLANKNAKFRFHGMASHAAAAPERGRSALDGVEAMDNMVNMLREHVPDSTRIHYVITKGGEAPNVVPAFAEVYYYVRSPSRQTVAEVFERVTNAARGGALGTGTTVDWEVIGGVTYTPAEAEFARKIGQTVYGKAPAPEAAALIQPFVADPPREAGGSTDVGDVSWTVPTVGLRAAPFAPGTPSHSWQAVACGGTTLGLKGMNVAAKTLGATTIDLFGQPGVIAQAQAEFEKRRGADFKYSALLGDRAPALDYRD